ncbi:NnrU family protein [Paracoccus zeaxanthinifaciens]|uniref:NnrU family protein n=1 Tax=Paracoccus zeaxanthinifaciens TaxID=187400 RepID=UPI0003B6D78A|nr:NnrU family protein [Paracoccus zeaxanthinifaciens]
MLILILGVALWWAAHLFKRAAPETRAKLGDPGKGAVAVALALSIVLMTVGYKSAVGSFLWGPSSATVGINNLLVLIAFYLFAASGMKTRVTALTRHPMLWGFAVWAFAHLLVNGDTPSIILFGGLLAWALVEMQVINRVSDHVPPTGPFPVRKEIMAVVGAVIVMLVAATIHGLVGPSPFGVS